MRWLVCMIVCMLLAVPVCAADDPVPTDQPVDSTEEGQELPSGSPAPPAVDLVFPDEPIPVILAEDSAVADAQPYAITGKPYDGGLSTSSLNYFSGVMRKYAGTDYVAFRADQYEYILCYGNIGLRGTVFFGDAVTVVQYNSRYDTYVAVGTDDLNLDAGSEPVYSSLGGYPELEGVSIVVWAKVGCVAAAVLMLLLVLAVILRTRRR